MTKLLLLLVLIITIPRWAQTLAQVDKFSIFGIPATAIGEGIVLEIACYLLIIAHGNAYEETQRYRADWEAHEQRMQEQGKQNRKPKTDPELAGYGQLMALYYVLLGLTIVSQWPFLMSALTGQPVTALLSHYGQWGYTLFLVIAPEIVTFALARAHHYGRICARRRQERQVRTNKEREPSKFWAFLDAQVQHIAHLLDQMRGNRSKSIQANEPSVQPESKKRPGKPTLDWWRSRYEQMNGDRAQMTPERVQELVLAEWELSPSRTTLYNWSDECVQSLDKAESNVTR